MSITVSIVEDAQGVREGLVRLLDNAPGFHTLASYPTAEIALTGIPAQPPDVVLMDIDLPGMNGVECVRKLKAILPQTQVMMLTVYEDTENIFNALAAGANGYLLKRTPSKEIIDAIREVHRGGSPMTTHIARLVVQSFQKTAAAPAQPAAGATAPTGGGGDLSELSEREQQVLDLLAQGLIYKEIADKLNIGYETVHTYIRRIYEKLQVRTRTEAVAKFLQR